MKTYINIFLACLFFLSCSGNDDLDDKIIGKWKMIERHESGVKVNIECNEYFFTEFRVLFNNNEVFGGHIDYNLSPQECKTISFSMSSWRVNNSRYEIFDFPNEILSIAYFENNNLVIEPKQLPYKFIYQRIN